MVRIALKTDVSRFIRSLGRISTKHAEAVVLGMARTVERARDAVRRQTKAKFELHSDYIPRGVRSVPDKAKVKALAGATKGLLGRTHQFFAAVYLRGSPNPKRDLSFMVLQETGGLRTPKNVALAIPNAVKKYSYQTSRGAVRRRWKPPVLLEHYNTVGSVKAGSKKRDKAKTRRSPAAFVLQSMLVRRKNKKTKKLEVLYNFARQAKIRAKWGFVDTVHRVVLRDLKKEITAAIKQAR